MQKKIHPNENLPLSDVQRYIIQSKCKQENNTNTFKDKKKKKKLNHQDSMLEQVANNESRMYETKYMTMQRS